MGAGAQDPGGWVRGERSGAVGTWATISCAQHSLLPQASTGWGSRVSLANRLRSVQGLQHTQESLESGYTGGAAVAASGWAIWRFPSPHLPLAPPSSVPAVWLPPPRTLAELRSFALLPCAQPQPPVTLPLPPETCFARKERVHILSAPAEQSLLSPKLNFTLLFSGTRFLVPLAARPR